MKAGEVAVKWGCVLSRCGEGFAKVNSRHVAILTEMAVGVDDIDEQAVEEARKRAEGRLRDETLTDEQIAAENAAIAHAMAQLDVKRRRGH